MNSYTSRSRRPISRSVPRRPFKPSLVAAEDRVAAGDLLWTALFADPTGMFPKSDAAPLPRLLPDDSAATVSVPTETPAPQIPVTARRGTIVTSRASEPKVLGPTLRLPALEADTMPSVAFGLGRVTASIRQTPEPAAAPANAFPTPGTQRLAPTAPALISTDNASPSLLAAPASRSAAAQADGVTPETDTPAVPVGTVATATPKVLAVTPKTGLTPTHAYVSEGRSIGMTISPGRVAVGGANADEVAAATAGLTFVRQLTPEAAVYEGLAAGSAASRAALAAAPGVDLVAPVFVVGETDSEAVLLDEVIVALRPGVTAESFFAGDERFTGYVPLSGTPDQFVATVAAGSGEATLAVANALNGDKRLAWAAPNFIQDWKKFYTPNDPRFTNLWHLNNTGQSGGLVDADPDLPEAWDVNQGGSSLITIAIVDDSVSTDHPDLFNWVNPGEIVGNGLDDDGNGWVDDITGWNFVGNNASSGPTTANDVHGTSVAGVAAARGDNSIGVTGAAYKSAVIGIRIFEGTGVATDANIAGALYYAAGRTKDGLGTWKAGDVVNNSWGGGANSTAINAALTWGTTLGRQGKGATYFFATGNGGGASASQPALQSQTIPGVVGVGAVANTGGRPSYSQYGPGLDFVTPSDGGTLAIDTTDRIGADGYDPSDYTGTGANGFGGTSSATPLATGIAALVLAQADAKSVSLTAAQLRNYLRNSTDLAGGVTYDPTTGKHVEYGTGRLNAFTAVSGIGKAEISVTSSTADFVSGTSVSNFGTFFVGQSKDVTFRVRNQGTSALSVGSLSVAAGPYSVVAGPGATTLNLGESTTFTLRFAPTDVGTIDRTVTLVNGDADEGTFTFTARGTGVVANVSGTAFEDWNGDGILAANDPTVAGAFVFADVNNNGVYDTPSSSFSNTTPLPIPDTNTAVYSDTVVSGVANPLSDVNVTVNITHTWDADLNVFLVAPDGTRVELFTGVGGSGDNFVNTTLDDQAATAITAGTAPFTGSFRPEGSLATLNGFTGAQVNGTWRLEITDTAAADVGTLNSWTLDFVAGTPEPSATTDAVGNYVLLSLPNGTYPIRTVTPSGWASTAPSGGHPVTITAPTDANPNKNFGQAKNNRFYGSVWDDKNGNGIREVGELPVAGRTVFVDANANGVYDANGISLTNATVLPIPDTNTKVYSDITVAGLANPLTDVNVTVNITHPFDADLDVFLVAPDGTRVELFTDVGGAGANFTNTVLDQQATATIATGTAPFTGRYRPEGNLDVLNGFSGAQVNGTWRLEIADDASADVGQLNSWTLELLTGTPEQAATSNALGNVSIDLPAGAADVRLAAASGFLFTNPADGKHAVAAAGSPLYQRNFGTRGDQPLVTGTPQVNAGSAQRSRVTGTDVTFLGTLTAGEQAALSYTLVRLKLADGTTDGTTTIASNGAGPQVTVTYAAAGANTKATLTFTGSGAGVQAGSLSEGVWQLTVRTGSTVLYTGPSTTATGAIYRLFGDIDGNRVVDTADLTQFDLAFGVPPVFVGFDYDNNGVIDTADLTQFDLRFGASI